MRLIIILLLLTLICCNKIQDKIYQDVYIIRKNTLKLTTNVETIAFSLTNNTSLISKKVQELEFSLSKYSSQIEEFVNIIKDSQIEINDLRNSISKISDTIRIYEEYRHFIVDVIKNANNTFPLINKIIESYVKDKNSIFKFINNIIEDIVSKYVGLKNVTAIVLILLIFPNIFIGFKITTYLKRNI
jgi:hypothetical protein